MSKYRLKALEGQSVERLADAQRRADYIKMIFERNFANCKRVNISVNKQVKELREYYGVSVTPEYMARLKAGLYWRVGFTLMMVLRDYWAERGIPFSLD